MPLTWSDEKLILLYCPGRGSNSLKLQLGTARPRTQGLCAGTGGEGGLLVGKNGARSMEEEKKEGKNNNNK